MDPQNNLNQPFLISVNGNDQTSLFKELLGVATSSTPYDFLTSLSSFLASLYLIANLYENNEDNDSSTVQLMTIFSQSACRIIFQAFVLPAFRHEGLPCNEQNQLQDEDIDKRTFKNSIAALLKIGAQSGLAASVLFGITPLLYWPFGVSPALIEDSYRYIEIAFAALFLQIINFSFQQTLVKMGKKNRMFHAAVLNGLFINLPLLWLNIKGNPLASVSPLTLIPSIFLVGNLSLSAYYTYYFSQNDFLPSLSTYVDEEDIPNIHRMYNSFKTTGFQIFWQLVSELGILYIQPFLVSLLFNQPERSSVLAQLGAAGVLNLFSIIFAITFSIAASNAVNMQAGHLSSSDEDKQIYCHNIRSIAVKSALMMLCFSVVLFGGLTVMAPRVMNLFYHSDNLDITGPSTNPYLLMLVIATGTTLDYFRNLALFILRSMNVNQYGTFASYFCLWLVNLALLYPVFQIDNIGVLGILLPYYAGILAGTLMLWTRLWECIKDDNTMAILVNREDPEHEALVKNKERWFGRSSTIFQSDQSERSSTDEERPSVSSSRESQL